MTVFLNRLVRVLLWTVVWIASLATVYLLLGATVYGWQALILLPAPAGIALGAATLLALLTTLDQVLAALERQPPAIAESLRAASRQAKQPPPAPGPGPGP